MCLDSHLNWGLGWHLETCLSPQVKYFYWQFQGGTSFVDHLRFLCLVFLILSCLFIAALWSPAGKGLTSWLLLMMFIVFLLLSHVVFSVRCGTWLYCFLIFAVFLTLKNTVITLFPPFTTNVVCLLICLYTLVAECKQYELRTDCSWRSSLIRIRSVCLKRSAFNYMEQTW